MDHTSLPIFLAMFLVILVGVYVPSITAGKDFTIGFFTVTAFGSYSSYIYG